MKAIYLLAFFLVSQTYSFCQVYNQTNLFIEGKVISFVNKKPLENVTVQVKNSTQGVLTKSAGYFNMSGLPAGKYHLVFSYIGYINADTILDISFRSIEKLTILLKAECSYNRRQAEHDIAKGTPKLLLVGSVAPVIYVKQHKFEKKYQVQYFDFGDTPPAIECFEEYNKKIFEYLDNKFGRKWRKEVRSDVVFFSK